MNTAKTLPLALVSSLFLGLTALLPLAAKAQPLDPADFQIQSFPVGNGPRGITFDGANIWVTNDGDGTVTKLRASDGTNLGTFSSGGGNPEWITFDGANIWVSNTGSSNVTKLRASDGAVLDRFHVRGIPEGTAYDGANIWVTSYYDGTVTKLRASDGVVLGVYHVGDLYLRGVLFDGISIWVATGDYLVKLDPDDGSLLGRVRAGMCPYALAFDGTKIWATNRCGDNTVTAVRAYNGAIVGTVPVGDYPHGIAFDGRHIFVANYYDDSVSVIAARNGAYKRTIRVERWPVGVCFDGTSIWVANSGSNTVDKISPASP